MYTVHTHTLRVSYIHLQQIMYTKPANKVRGDKILKRDCYRKRNKCYETNKIVATTHLRGFYLGIIYQASHTHAQQYNQSDFRIMYCTWYVVLRCVHTCELTILLQFHYTDFTAFFYDQTP